MYAILCEDESDAKAMMQIVRKLHTKDRNVAISTKGYRGCGELLRKGYTQLQAYNDLGKQYFIIVYDADSSNPKDRENEVIDKIIKPTSVEKSKCCVVVPVQELEAWILADLDAVRRVFSTWRPTNTFPNPERIQSPKEHLEKISRDEKKKQRYYHATHNPLVASHLDLDIVAQKCPSFRPLRDFVNRVNSGTI